MDLYRISNHRPAAGTLHVDRFPSLAHAFFAFAAEHPELEVYSQLQNLPSGVTVASRLCSEVLQRIQAVALFLRGLGAGNGTKVAILSNTRPEWMEADLGILTCGGATVSIYQSLPANDVGYILFDSQAEIVFAENQEQVDKLLVLNDNPLAVAGTEDRPAQTITLSIKHIVCFEECVPHPLVSGWRSIVVPTDASERVTPADVGPDDLAALVYTSGTTGPPKGVMQTHGNHLANVRQTFESGLLSGENSLTLFLPLAHSFAKLMGYIGFLSPVRIGFPAIGDRRSSRVDPANILRDIRELGSEIVPVVPRFLEKMKEGLEAQSRRRNMKGRLLKLTIWAARERAAAKRENRAPGILASLAYRGTAGLRAKVKRHLFGPNFRFAVSGGAKLPVDVAEMFAGFGIDVCEGYGLTETCVATNVNRITANKIGTVGPVLAPDIELRLAEDGEILFRGPNITKGYYQRPTATAAAWDSDGWFHTGDLGAIDADGFLSIIGRKKELIVTSGGKKIPPQAIEDRLKSIPLVSQAVVVGDNRPFCIALVTLDLAAVKDWGARAELPPDTDWPHCRRLFDAIWAEVDAINTTLSSFETVKNIFIVPEEFTIDNGLLTPTFKTKRNLIEKKFQREIDELYRETRKL